MRSSFRLTFLLTILFSFFSPKIAAQVNISNSWSWNSTSPRISVDSSGNAHAIWVEMYSDTSGDVFYSRRSAGSPNWSSPLNLSNSSAVYCESLMMCDVATDDSDRVYVVWTEGNAIKLRIYSGGSWGGTTQVESSGSRLDAPRMAASPEGNIYIVWWATEGSIYSKSRVEGSWEGTKFISVPGKRSKFPAIAAGNGVVYSVWVEKSGDLYQAVYTRRNKGLNSSWSAPNSVYSSGQSHQHPQVELDSSDIAHVIWTTYLDGPRVVHHSYWTGGGFSSPQEISSTQMLHYPSTSKRGSNIYVVWQVGAYSAGISVNYNIYQNGKWRGEDTVPKSGGCTFTDISASPDGTKVVFVWDSGGEIYFYELTSDKSPNQLPVADFTFSPTTGTAPLKVNFDASTSRDPDGQIVRYDWNFGDGSTATGKIVSHTFNIAGNYNIRLTVTDDKGGQGIKVKAIEVQKPNQPPVADFTFSPSTGLFPLEVSFDASSSYDPDGKIARYEWTFGDGGTGQGKTIKYTYYKWGSYTIILKVVDDRGAEASKQKSIEILKLYLPLNIRWQTFVDESLFQTRYVTDITWEKNPKNDGIATIAYYRVYRKKTDENIKAFGYIGQVDGNTFIYRDTKVEGKDLYVYVVTAVDGHGHESPIEENNSVSLDKGNPSLKNSRIILK